MQKSHARLIVYSLHARHVIRIILIAGRRGMQQPRKAVET